MTQVNVEPDTQHFHLFDSGLYAGPGNNESFVILFKSFWQKTGPKFSGPGFYQIPGKDKKREDKL